MHSTDRDEFNGQVRTLMGAHGDFPAAEKVEAYWIAFAKLSLIQFTRLIEYALSEEGPDKMPTVPQLWDCWREMRRVAPAQAAAGIGVATTMGLAEQLCTYVSATVPMSASERTRPWEYIYREWSEGKSRQCELIALRFDRDDGTVSKITVAQMLADREGYTRAMHAPRGRVRPMPKVANVLKVIPPALVAAEPAHTPVILDAPVMSPEEQVAAAQFFAEVDDEEGMPELPEPNRGNLIPEVIEAIKRQADEAYASAILRQTETHAFDDFDEEGWA